MGLFSKLKEANHKRNQTRNSIFLSSDSVTSNTSSETSNYKHPTSSKKIPKALKPNNKPKPRPQSEYYNVKKLPEIRPERKQANSHSRTYSNQENELPLMTLGDDTLQFDVNDISLDEVTEQLIDHKLFSVMDNKPRPSSFMPSTERTKYPRDEDVDEDFHSILDPRQNPQRSGSNIPESSNVHSEIPTEVQTPEENFGEQSLILNQQEVPGAQHQQVQETAQPPHFHHDVNQLFSYPNQSSQQQPVQERGVSPSNVSHTPIAVKSPRPQRIHHEHQQLHLQEQSQEKPEEQQPQEAEPPTTTTQPQPQAEAQRPPLVPLQFQQTQLFPQQTQQFTQQGQQFPQQFFGFNQPFQTSPQFYPAPAPASQGNEESAEDDDDSTGSSEYSSSEADEEEDEEDESLSSGSSIAPTQHPYYEQWRRYYEALAQQQQFMMRQQQQQQQPQMTPGGFPGFNPMMFYGNPQMMQQMQMQMPYFYNPFMAQSGAGTPQGVNDPASGMYQQPPSQAQSKAVIPPAVLEEQQQQPDQSCPQSSERKSSDSSTHIPLRIAPSPPSKRNSYVSVAHAANEYPNESQVSHDYLLSYKKSRNIQSEKIEEDNELISNSRRSTVKSNRYASAPLNIAQERRMSSMGGNARVTSLEMNFKPTKYRPYNGDDELGSRPGSRALSVGQSSQSLAKLNLQDREAALSRHISDYSKFLFDDDDDDDDDDSEEDNEGEEEDDDTARRVDIMGHRRKSSANVSPNEQLPTPNSDEGLSRNGTAASAASYDSIQSGGSSKFIVADGRRKLAIPAPVAPTPVPATKSKKKSKKSKKLAKQNNTHATNGFPFNPNMSMPELPMGAMMPMPPPPLVSHSNLTGSTDQFMMMNYSNPLLSQLTEYGGGLGSAPRSRRQSITTTDSKRRSMMMETPSPKINKRSSVPVFSSLQMQKHKQKQSSPPPRVQDSTINKKIEQFIHLRSSIAAGNKTAEYRLHWVKMLITATNYKLYSYINIKGEGIQPEQQAANKAQFIKSSVTHITKLIKEFASGVQERDGVRCEAYFIYANLWKQDYLISYNQDFSMEKNIDKAIEYYEKVLEINNSNFKALYKLGEIFEYDMNDFPRAVEYYTHSAKFGYNRAILKMAMLYLQVPEMRSIKYFKYLKNLSNIDLNEVQLDEEDLAEMEEVIGLASYELGKIFEGIYPGDLTTEDEFIKKSLELAPVNYAKSLTYYNKSAKLNCLLAQVRLGIVYEKGELNRQLNPSKSIQWYIKALSSPLSFKRHPDAMVGLARWCLLGSNGASKYILAPVPDRAVMWCERAIEEFESPDAMLFMGELCEMGIAKGKARSWFERAYRLGNQEAALKLGYF
ncbi:Activator of C kinase protein 1 [Candida viswanathii]|uniref:Activator of C kinase protein 1 n=1 Tax=Candida viswanathii TaxID=5486 RepID=A0A367YCJ2_9ASCO|nr:Activator of C kinase protein 1 [Candida viswanathii]